MSESPQSDGTPEGEAGEGAPPSSAAASLERGHAVILAASKTMPGAPGVYRMLDGANEALYVGKAKNLRKRVASYARLSGQPVRIRRMIALTTSLEITVTETEAEALLLEGNLIKRLKPRFNILLRDDKSYPYILLTSDHPWPQIAKHRGARKRKGEYFGPFASAGAVNQTLTTLQRAFPLRSCSDNVFEARTRPCLQYQIKRCTAPCCGRIGPEDYRILVEEAREFLTGKSREVQHRLTERMLEASAATDFETAAAFRDRIRALTQIQARQELVSTSLQEADVIAAHQEAGRTSVQVFFFRSGHNYGNRSYFPAHTEGAAPEAVLGAFIGQFYQNKPVPKLILLSHAVDDRELVERALSQHAGRRITLHRPVRGEKRTLVEHALRNAREALARRLSESASQRRLLERLAEAIDLDALPERIEVFDNSHIAGSQAVGAMIVVGPEGFVKSAYRKFTIRQAGDGGYAPEDDYGMMREVLGRRFGRLLKEDPEREQPGWPDLVLVDGGIGQLNVALDLFADLGIRDIALAGIAKGPDRNAGEERIYLPGGPPIRLDGRDPVLYFLQRVRDEAHRFAIGTHRKKRSRALGRSELDDIPGIGPTRKRALLHHFGSARGVTEAGLADLETVDGISKTVARLVYDHFHGES
jgi:excinuclease ABC subunit C